MPSIKLDVEIDVDVSLCQEGVEVLVFDSVDDVIAEKVIPWGELEEYPFEYSKIPVGGRDILVNTGYHNSAQDLEDLICKMEDSARRMRKRLEESSIFFRDEWARDTTTNDASTDQAYEKDKYTKPFSYDMVNKND